MSTNVEQLASSIDASSDDDLRALWTRRAGLGHPKVVAIIEGLLLAAMRDRGMDAPPIGDDPPPDPQPPASRPTADRDAAIVVAVLGGASHKAVAAAHGLSAAHCRRITAEARQNAQGSSQPRSNGPRCGSLQPDENRAAAQNPTDERRTRCSAPTDCR